METNYSYAYILESRISRQGATKTNEWTTKDFVTCTNC